MAALGVRSFRCACVLYFEFENFLIPRYAWALLMPYPVMAHTRSTA